MLGYITHDILCYITYVMLYNTSYVILYNRWYVMLYNILYIRERRLSGIKNKLEDATERTLRRRGCGTN